MSRQSLVLQKVGKAITWNRKRHTVMLSLPGQGERPWDGFCCWNLAPNGAVTPGDGHSPADRQWPSHPQTKSSKGLVSQEGLAWCSKTSFLPPLQCHSTVRQPIQRSSAQAQLSLQICLAGGIPLIHDMKMTLM